MSPLRFVFRSRSAPWALAILLAASSPLAAQNLQPLMDMAQVAAGEGYTCALTTAGGAKCWGTNHLGNLGDGSTTLRPTPVDVFGLASGVSALTTRRNHTCARTSGGGVQCWGAFDELFGGLPNSTVPVELLEGGVAAIDTGRQHLCGITVIGGVKCLGGNTYGQLGDGSNTPSLEPVDAIGLGSGVAAISARFEHSCAVTAGGAVKCWGLNNFGQLGDGTQVAQYTPVTAWNLTSGVAAISTGYEYTCALTTGGGVKCWGNDLNGQLGDGGGDIIAFPVDVAGLGSGVAAISAGYAHACALTTAGGVKCWGDNDYGQLGDGSTTTRLAPVDVSGLASGVAAISASRDHTCAVTTAGGIKCWGRNDSGELGDGSTEASLVPVDVQVAASDDASLATLSLAPNAAIVPLAPDTTDYIVAVAHDVDAIAFVPTASDAGAGITVNGQTVANGTASATFPLAVDVNTFVIRVTAADDLTTRDYRVEVIRLSDLPAALRIAVRAILGPAVSKGGAETRQYRVTTYNLGTAPALGVHLTVPMPRGLRDVDWTCAAPTGCAPAAGTGGVGTGFDLASGAAAHVDLIGDVSPGVPWVDLAAQAHTASGGMQVSRSLSEPANGIGVMKTGFED